MYNIYIVFAYYIFVENGPGGMYKGTLPGRVEEEGGENEEKHE